MILCMEISDLDPSHFTGGFGYFCKKTQSGEFINYASDNKIPELGRQKPESHNFLDLGLSKP